jgi:small subunit ribosomal protein S11
MTEEEKKNIQSEGKSDEAAEAVDVLSSEKDEIGDKGDVAEGKDAIVAEKKKKKAKRQIQKGEAHIQCTYNNTKVAISDMSGGILGWSSSGLLGFKGAKKSTPYAATQVTNDASEKVSKYGVRELDVFMKGVGSGREACIRALANKGFALISIKDITPVPHNGCRPRKPRRV